MHTSSNVHTLHEICNIFELFDGIKVYFTITRIPFARDNDMRVIDRFELDRNRIDLG